MSSRSIVLFIHFALVHATSVLAQGWELERVINVFNDTVGSDHFVFDLDGSTLACGRSTPYGGDVKLYHRHAGGYRQWDIFHSFTSTLEGYGYALDMDHGRLALARRRGDGLSAQQGGVSLYDLQPLSSTDQVIGLGFSLPGENVVRDGYGHSVLVSGDTLFVGAVGRSHPRGSGAVHMHVRSVATNGLLWPEIDLLQPPAAGFELPIMDAFGTSLLLHNGQLIVSSPGSGYSNLMRCGALHSFERNGPSGAWAERDHWFDATYTLIETEKFFEQYEVFFVNDLGRTGLHRVHDLVIADWASPYRAPGMFEIPDGPALTPACDGCGLKNFRMDMDGSIVEEISWVDLDTATHRGYRSWTAYGELIAVNVFAADTWETRIYRKPSWTDPVLVATIPAGFGDADHNGPLLLKDDVLVRSGTRPGQEVDERSFFVEIFRIDAFTGVEDHPTVSPLTVQPSPSNGSCTVRFNGGNNWRLSVFAADGRSIEDGLRPINELIELHGLSAGLYVLKASDAKGSKAPLRLVVQ